MEQLTPLPGMSTSSLQDAKNLPSIKQEFPEGVATLGNPSCTQENTNVTMVSTVSYLQNTNLLSIKQVFPEESVTSPLDNTACSQDYTGASEVSTACYLQNTNLLSIKQEFPEESVTPLANETCTQNNTNVTEVSTACYLQNTKNLLSIKQEFPEESFTLLGNGTCTQDNPSLSVSYLQSANQLHIKQEFPEETATGQNNIPCIPETTKSGCEFSIDFSGNGAVVNENSGSPSVEGRNVNTVDMTTTNLHCARKKQQYRRPLRKEKKGTVKKCIVCSKNISSQQLKAHMTVHEIRGELICKKCDSVIKTYSSWLKHTHGDCPKLTHKCHVCGKGFQRRDILDKHKRVHSQERPFKCNRCDFAFKQRAHFIKHWENLHTEEPGGNSVGYPIQEAKSDDFVKDCHKCSICKLTFSTESGLFRHLNIHVNKPKLNQKLNKCHNCGEVFRTKFNLHVHRRNCKVSDNVMLEMEKNAIATHNFKCTICEKVLHYKATFMKHLQKHRISNSSSTESSKQASDFKCSVCQLVFSSYHSLLGHKRTHSNQQHSPSKSDENSSIFQSQGVSHLLYNASTNSSDNNSKYDICDETCNSNQFIHRFESRNKK